LRKAPNHLDHDWFLSWPDQGREKTAVGALISPLHRAIDQRQPHRWASIRRQALIASPKAVFILMAAAAG
jgi:hypothetical protein